MAQGKRDKLAPNDVLRLNCWVQRLQWVAELIVSSSTGSLSQFATEEACRAYLTACRWPDGFVCPQCRSRSARELD
jgi:hypothetical protein